MKKRFVQSTRALCALVVICSVFSACSGPSGETGGSSSAEKASSLQSSASLSSEDLSVAAAAKKIIQKQTSAQGTWTGPTTGPKAAKGKSIVCINADSKNAVEAMWGEGTAEAAKKIGWKCTVLDGKGTVNGQTQALNQAISMKVDGIVTSADVQALQETLGQAKAAGIPVVGIHGSAVSGADEKDQLLYNCTTPGTAIGKALADYVIADSNGKGRVIVLYDSLYAIARQKAEAMKSELATCPGVRLLDYVNSPLAQVPTNMPQLASSWISKYGGTSSDPLYVLSIADYYYDFVTPTLRSGNVDPSGVRLLGCDGTTEAYNRIRSGNYQVATVPEPTTEFPYIAIDELNRYFNGQPVVNYTPEPYIVTKDNIDKEGGDKGLFIPSNNFADEYAKIWGVQ